MQQSGALAPFPVSIDSLLDSTRCTTLGFGKQRIATVEHVLSALAGCGVDNCLVRVDGGEIPAMDGSALPFVEAIREVGMEPQPGFRKYLELEGPVWIQENGSSLVALPSDSFRITCGIEFGHRVLGRQLYSLEMTPGSYEKEIAPARTFGFLHEVEELHRRGLARGGSMENAVVIGEDGYLVPLRYSDEPVRHKVLDLVGDLALLGAPLRAQVIALKTSHRVNTLLVRSILDSRRA